MGRAGTHQHRASHGRNNSMPHMVQDGIYGDIVLVVGGSGFLGHFLIQLLAEKGENIAEIRSLDIKAPPIDFSIDNPNIKLSFIEASILEPEELCTHFEGVNVVIHTASFIDTCNFPDDQKMFDVNVQGTSNVIEACQRNNVETLIVTGSSEVGRGYEERVNYNEDMIDLAADNPDKELMFPGYFSTKREAERMVLRANKMELANGKIFHTIVLRPCGIYGEGDNMYVTTVLRVGSNMFGGFIPVLGSKSAKIDRVFVGNVAWAHVTAFNEIRRNKGVCGQSYLIVDDTPSDDNFTWMRPFLESHSIKLLPFSIPLFVVFYFWMFLAFIVKLLLPFGLRIKLLSNKNEVHMCCTTCHYNGEKARTVLGYRPFFTYKESFRLAFQYYQNLDLKA